VMYSICKILFDFAILDIAQRYGLSNIMTLLHFPLGLGYFCT